MLSNKNVKTSCHNTTSHNDCLLKWFPLIKYYTGKFIVSTNIDSVL